MVVGHWMRKRLAWGVIEYATSHASGLSSLSSSGSLLSLTVFVGVGNLRRVERKMRPRAPRPRLSRSTLPPSVVGKRIKRISHAVSVGIPETTVSVARRTTNPTTSPAPSLSPSLPMVVATWDTARKPLPQTEKPPGAVRGPGPVGLARTAVFRRTMSKPEHVLISYKYPLAAIKDLGR